MDPVSLLVGAIIAVGGIVVGRMLPARRVKPEPQPPALPSAPRSPKPMCGCGHHLVFHDHENKRCQAQVVIPGKWTGQSASSYRPCMCQGYRGPVPLDEYYAPDLLNGES
ncbi:hypothetical protein CLV63_14215 [Murinocardiopsis flavida]|uniref:Uncharacterized protein n=1 Tax=Murinocardiopsis flavida TaxID=645275 RepID=A0A2P8CCF0_9ACTN|nr:hypothetical protein [Murinocardiopsis flavida]PSK82602.1 hypothetical protein CLV63_14215 [Murinocardiopsis flavida]